MTTDKMLTSKGKVLHMLHFFVALNPLWALIQIYRGGKKRS